LRASEYPIMLDLSRLALAGNAQASYPCAMTGRSGKSSKLQGRDKRLAAALRENLRRRKAQARGRDKGPESGPTSAKSREGGDPGSRSQS
jgi:hypothetical protein